MKRTFIIPVILVAGMFSSCGNSPGEKTGTSSAIEGTISISGAFALYPLVNVWAEEFRKEYPNVKFSVSAGGAGKGMADAISGAVDLGMFSRTITQAEKDKGVWWVAVTKDAVIPTMSAQNPLIDRIRKEGLTRQELADMWLVKGDKKWKDSNEKAIVYTRSDAAGAAGTWAEYLGAEGQEALHGIAVFGDPGLADAVKNDASGIGFNNVIYIYDLASGQKYPGIEVVPIDINENGTIDAEENFYNNIDEITAAIVDGRYPSPPARELYFVAKEKPTDPAVTAFLKWVLDKGQLSVESNGYILLDKSTIEAEQAKL